MSREPSPAVQLRGFLRKFDPSVARLARASLARVRRIAPGAIELVYDAYNALAIGFSWSDRTGDAFIHVAVYPRHVNIGFNRGVELRDPRGLLQGQGSRVRHVRIEKAADLANQDLARLIRSAAGTRKGGTRRLIIKGIYARQRPRRPAPGHGPPESARV